jgi:hypothetical protein
MKRVVTQCYVSTLAIIVVFCAAARAQGVVLVSEPFDYATGPLHGLNGGVGFSSPWSAPGNFSVVAGNLSVPGYSGTGGSMQIVTNLMVSAGRNLNAIYATGSEVWASYLVNLSSVNAYAGLSFSTADVPFSGVFVGVLGGPNGAGPPSSTWGMDYTGGSDPVLSNVAIAYGENTLLVVRITEEAGMDRFDLYVNPPESLPASPDATKLLYNHPDWSFNKVSYSVNRVSGVVDEIRLGETYEDVRPVPEPCALVLVALGGAVVLLRRFV